MSLWTIVWRGVSGRIKMLSEYRLTKPRLPLTELTVDHVRQRVIL